MATTKNKGNTTELSAWVPTEHYQEFTENFPMYGASSWFIRNALISFNKQVREFPEFKAVVERSIERMLEESRTGVVLTAD